MGLLAGRIKNVSILRATHLARLLLDRALRVQQKLVLRISSVCQRSPYLVEVRREFGKRIIVEKGVEYGSLPLCVRRQD